MTKRIPYLRCIPRYVKKVDAFYASKFWRKLRRVVLSSNPGCPCGLPATEVDHVIARSKGGTHEISNLQALCKRCHSRKTTAVDGRFG